MDGSSYESNSKIKSLIIVDYYSDDVEKILEISTRLLTLIHDSKLDNEVKYNYKYDEKTNKARFVLWGSPTFINKATAILKDYEEDGWNKN